MAQYTASRLLDDVFKEKGALVRGQALEKSLHQQVWDAFNRYVTATLEQRRTLDVPNFGKIGWRIEHFQGKVKYRPHFQLADSFLRIHELDVKRHIGIPDCQLSTIEEFNYSKAAIKYSQGLTKANMFVGLRAIVHKIGQACARLQVSIDFEVGQLLCNERVVHFAFAGELYQQEGLEVPTSAQRDSDYQPSRTFSSATAEGLALCVRGRSGSKTSNAVGRSEPAQQSDFVCRCDLISVDGGSALSLESEDAHSTSISVASGARDIVQQVALERHLEVVKAEVEDAHLLKARDEVFMDECDAREAAVSNRRRVLNLDHKQDLKRQMRALDEKRQAGRENAIAQASQHDFPSFREKPKREVLEYMGERKRTLKEDLDQQVRQKLQVKNTLRQLEIEVTAKDDANSKAEVQRQTLEETAKKELERRILSDAWDRSVRLKQVQKSIDTYHMTPANNQLDKLMRNKMPPLLLPEQRPDTCSSTSARLSTGSARGRRMPIGAAASLALRQRAPNSARS